MHSYTLTIDRNIGTEPMSDKLWGSFKLSAYYTLFKLVGWHAIAERFHGEGEWEGVKEESYKLTALTETPLDAFLLEKLKRQLRIVAADYRQDAIALTIGESELVTPAPITLSGEFLDGGAQPLRASSHVSGYRGEVTR